MIRFARIIEKGGTDMLSSQEITRKWEGIAQAKAELKAGKCLLLGLLAGMFIAFGGLGSTIAQACLSGGAGKFVGACVFPTGLILVVMAGAELFTGNCLMAGPALQKKVPWRGVMRNWGLVYLGNMAGAFLTACIALFSGFMKNAAVADAAMNAALGKCSLSFGEALFRGIGCNMLVCGAVWMASGAKDAPGKAVCCFFPIMLFVLCGFEHSVANMYYVPLGLGMNILSGSGALSGLMGAEASLEFCRQVTWEAYLVKNLLPVTLGNIIGGAGLAMIYAKANAEKNEKA